VSAASRRAGCPEPAHSVHVEVRGLRPAREYFYRFRAKEDLDVPGENVLTVDKNAGSWHAYDALGVFELTDRGRGRPPGPRSPGRPPPTWPR
jgi:hypothetical protein